MSNIDKKLSDVFGVEHIEQPCSNDIAEIKRDAVATDKAKELKYVKDTMISMIEKGKNAISELEMVARDSEKSRDYEVLFNGIKSVTEIAEKLLDTDQAVKQEDKEKPQTVNQTAVFVGSTAELAKLFKQS